MQVSQLIQVSQRWCLPQVPPEGERPKTPAGAQLQGCGKLPSNQYSLSFDAGKAMHLQSSRHLKQLESESIAIVREVAAEFRIRSCSARSESATRLAQAKP